MGAFIPIRRWFAKKIKFNVFSLASGWLPLLTNLFGNIGGDATFSRATVATVRDFEYKTHLCKAEEIRFEGARRVANFANYSEDFTDASWLMLALAVKTGPAVIDGIPCMEVALLGGLTAGMYQQPIPLIVGHDYTARALVRSKVGTINLRISVGNQFSTDIAVGEKWVWIGYTKTNLVGGLSIAIRNETAGGVKDIYIAAFQAEDVTNQTIQGPSEYVSSNALAAPYHGANVDGVKYFETYNATAITVAGGGIVTDAVGAALPDVKGYLNEPASTNEVIRSGALTSGGWTNINCGSSITTSLDSLGNKFARINPVVAGNAIQGTADIVVTPGARYTVQAELQKNVSDFAGLVIADVANLYLQGGAIFDLVNGLVISTAGAGAPTATMRPGIGANTWVCELSADMDALQAACTYGATASDGATYGNTVYGSAAVGQFINVSNMQFELGSVATSIIPTVAAPVTRDTDKLLSAVAAEPVLLDPIEGTMYCEFGIKQLNNSMTLMVASDGTLNNSIELLVNNTSRPRFVLRSPGVVVIIIMPGPLVINAIVKVAISWRDNYCVASLNGANSFDLIASPMASVLSDKLQIGNRTASPIPAFATIRNCRTWDYQVADQDLIVLTTP